MLSIPALLSLPGAVCSKDVRPSGLPAGPHYKAMSQLYESLNSTFRL